MLRSVLLATTLIPALLFSGCTSVTDSGAYPSLDRRSIELRVNPPADSPPPAVVPPPVTAELTTAIAALEADAGRGDMAFQTSFATVRPMVTAARSAASGTEGWFAAQAALSGLDQALGATRLALTELDRLHVAAEMDGRAADAVLLAGAAARVARMAAQQRAAFDQLGGMLAE